MGMTIYFKNGETLHIPGEEGEKLKQDIGDTITGQKTISGFLTAKNDETGTVTLILDIDEVVCIR